VIARAGIRRALLLAVLGAGLSTARAGRAADAAAPKPWYEEVAFNGFVSTSYSYNFNRPPSQLNGYRVFDFDDNSFKVDVAELAVQRAVAQPGDAGLRLDLELGGSVPRISAAQGLFRDSLSGPGQDMDLQQAFVSYVAPVGSGLRLDAGKFVTFVGAEVIEGYDGWNDNATRSFLFGYAIPFTHAGVKASYAFSPKVSALAVLANGWDVDTDNNSAKTVGAQLALTPVPQLSVWLGGITGAERTDSDKDRRNLADLVAVYHVTPKLTFSVNSDYGREAGAVPGATHDAEWLGTAGYVRWQAHERFALIARGETFDDRDGVRTGTVQTLNEVTLTPELHLTPKVILRADVRMDWSSWAVFEMRDGFTDRQSTVLVSALASF
jgi:hypothetical protein